MTSHISSQPPRVPLLSEALLKGHECYFEIDTRFRRAARLLQALWLKDHNIATGFHVRQNEAGDTVMPLSSVLSAEAARAGRNFLTADIHAAVRRELLMREIGACYDEERLFGNALSSGPLTMNLLIPLAQDLDLATAVFRRLLPDVIHQVLAVRFETAPLPRRDPAGLEDGTAFDAAIDAVDPDGVPITCFIEIKYSEDMCGPAARLRETYDIRSREVRLFIDPDSPTLRNLGLEQLWREAMLAQIAVDRGCTPRAHFMAIGPRLNRRVQVAFQNFANELIPADDQDPDRIGFTSLTLESFIEAIRDCGNVELANALWQRYADFGRVFDYALDWIDQQARATDQAFPIEAELAPLVHRDRRAPVVRSPGRTNGSRRREKPDAGGQTKRDVSA
ncbi:PGN_0703 family putative restriction endonuclease [Tardiphaga sp.]|jgi:hypothetical protein|uniref:PGN_0703 family putative restriction endonuclease n=1 Tax=Tardiphaga sp. TaxID=1926292 RepID=UPI0037D9BD51